MKHAVLILLLILFSTAQGQTLDNSVGAASLPDTAMGVILRDWVTAVNTGNRDEIRKFVDSNFSANAFRYQQTADEYTNLFVKLNEQSGGIDVVKATPYHPPQPMAMIVKSRKGNRYALITCGLDRGEKQKLAGLGIDKTDAPEAGKLSDITKSLSESETIAAIKKYVGERAASGDFSGVILIAKDDKILLHKAYGFADREAKLPNRADTKFHLASIGKMFTAVAIAQLVKDGKLSFDDAIAKVLPDYPNKEVAQKVTIHQLLTHSAGFGTFFESPGFVKGKVYRNASEEIGVYKDEKLFFEPGASWRYSNAGYSLLAAMIERVSGENYLDYIRDNIFLPLGMHDTYTSTPGKAAPNSSVFYTQSPADPLGLEPFIADRSLATDQAHGFGGGYSNAPDMFKFLRAYRSGKLLGPDLTLKLLSGKVKQDASGRKLYGYAISESSSNGEIVRGHTGGSRSDVEMLWNSDYSIIILTNAIPPPVQSLTREIVDFITKQNANRSERTVIDH